MGEVAFGAPRLLADGDDLGSFRCGVKTVDAWAHRWAQRAMQANTARVYVACAAEGSQAPRVAGLYSLSTYAVKREKGVAGALRRNAPDPIPCTLLGMLGVDERFQGRGLGWSLLRDAVLRARRASRSVASRALVVEPADERAAAFYARFGFAPLDGGGERMFVKL